MASQAGQTSKILILVLASWTGSVAWRSQRSSDLSAKLQELLKDFNGAEFSSGRCDTAAIAALIRQLAQEIKELTLSNPAATFNCNCSCNGSYASYLLPATALVAMVFCYMWWKGWSFSDVISVTKQLENVHETLAPTRCLTEKLEDLSQKVEEQNELNQFNANNASEVKLKLSRSRLTFEEICEKISRMDEELKLAESKQNMTISSVRRLGQWIVGLDKEQNREVSEEVSAEQGESSSLDLQTIGIEGTSSKAIIQRSYQINIPQDGDTIG